MNEAKTKALISCAVIAQLICTFVEAKAISKFSHDVAQITWINLYVTPSPASWHQVLIFSSKATR